MARYRGTAEFKHGAAAPIGILLCNLGTPEAPTASAVRTYLAEFLADPRIVELPRVLWMPILHCIILNVRPRRSAHAYAQIWTAEGSPLMTNSRAQHAAVSEALEAAAPGHYKVALGMRYGQPSIASALRELAAANVRRVLVLPLYPQYSAPSTASVIDAVTAELRDWRWVPELRTVMDYHADEDYIEALASSVREYRANHGSGERLMISFHGIPRRYFLAGDPYFCQCQATARLLAERLGLRKDEWLVTFQSRFGREKWLEPYTDITLAQMARDGLRKVDVVCPGFAADCLETLEEIAVQNREGFEAAGGHELRYIPALNRRPDHIQLMLKLIQQHTAGWPGPADVATRTDAATRARTMGAVL